MSRGFSKPSAHARQPTKLLACRPRPAGLRPINAYASWPGMQAALLLRGSRMDF